VYTHLLLLKSKAIEALAMYANNNEEINIEDVTLVDSEPEPEVTPEPDPIPEPLPVTWESNYLINEDPR